MANGTNTGTEEKAPPANKAAGRGPSYPALTIEQAITKALQFWGAEKRSAAPIAAAAKHWGYSETSSSGKVAVAALLHYGLLEDQGASGSRTVKLTGRGLDIVLDAPDSPKRLKAIQDALLTPKLYADILTKWPAHELPSDQTLRYYLLREKSFNEGSVDGFIKDLRASIAYADLDKPTTIPSLNVSTEESGTAEEMSEADVINRVLGQPAAKSTHAATSLAPAAGFLDESYPLDGGRAFVLRRPEVLSQEELEEFDSWIALLQRKMKRLIQQ
jgi:hypothetical protein